MKFEKYGSGYTIALVLAIQLTYIFFQKFTDYALGYSEGTVVGLRMAMTQFVIILIPTLYLTNKQGLKFTDYYTIKHFNFKMLYSIILGFLGVSLFIQGYLLIQSFFVPNSLVPVFKELEQVTMARYKTAFYGTGNMDFYIAVFAGAFTPALCEEFLLRGYLLSNLNRTNGYFRAILISSILFSISHLNPIQFAPYVAFGIFLGFTTYYSKSLLAASLVHFVNNFFAVLAFYFEPFAGMASKMELIPFPIAASMTIGGALLLIFSINNMKNARSKIII